jgi:DNA-binding CsgD family transcriptional regulator
LTRSDPGTARQIDRIYQAAVAPDHWPMFLESLSQELEAQTFHLAFRLPSDGDHGVLLTLGMDEHFLDAYCTHFYSMDPWMPSLAMEKEGDIQTLENCVSDRELEHTEIFNDWMHPQDIFYGFGAILGKSDAGDLVSSLSAFREKSRGPFRNEELDRIRPLVPHLQRALGIHRRLQTAELRAGAAEEALDRISSGVILLDERGAPISTNRAADGILAMNDGLVLDPDGPSASTPRQTGELRGLVSGAAATGAGKGTDSGGVMRLARPSGRPALEAVVTPIRCESSPLFDRKATSAIFLAASDARAERPPERLRRIYGLTPMEAEVASRIASGMGLGEITDALGISIHTVRGHLKQLFRKTGAHRQAELVRVLLSGVDSSSGAASR